MYRLTDTDDGGLTRHNIARVCHRWWRERGNNSDEREISVGSKAGATCRDCRDVACTMPPTPECPLASYVMHGAPGCAIDAAAMFSDRNLILKDFSTGRFDRNQQILRVRLRTCRARKKQFPETRGGSSMKTGAMCGCGGNGAASVMSPDVYGMSGLHRQVSDSGSADGRNTCCGSRFWSASGLFWLGTALTNDMEDSDTLFERGARYEKSDNMIQED